MGRRDQLLGAIDAIYDAAIGTVPWCVPLEQMARVLGGQFCALEFVDKTTGQMRSIESSSAPEITRDYIDEYFKLCPRYSVTKPVGRIVADYDVMDEQGMNRHPFYADFLGSHGMRYFAGTYLRNTVDDLVAVSVQRACGHGHVQNGEIRHFEVLVPHLRRAVEISQRLDSVSEQASNYAAGLDQLSDGIVFLDERGGVVHMNSFAEALLRQNDGLYIANKTLRAALPEDNAALSRMVAAPAGAGPLGDGHSVELAVARPSGLPAYVVSAIPLRPHDGRARRLCRACVVLAIRDPMAVSPPRHETLRQAFGLTDAEASLALALAAGETPASYAMRAQVKMPTVRSQLSALFRKMHVARQADVVRIVTRLAASFHS